MTEPLAEAAFLLAEPDAGGVEVRTVPGARALAR